jgi:hypothetical protein
VDRTRIEKAVSFTGCGARRSSNEEPAAPPKRLPLFCIQARVSRVKSGEKIGYGIAPYFAGRRTEYVMVIAAIIAGIVIAALGLDALTSSPKSTDPSEENWKH